MQSPSFRQILSRFLEENAPETETSAPPANPAFTAKTHDFIWTAPAFQNVKPIPKHAYTPPAQEAKPAPKIDSPKPPQPKKPEPRFQIGSLPRPLIEAIAQFAQLGASELGKSEICLSQVKKAHRRLIKRLHPDAVGCNSPTTEQFMKVQRIYECLCKGLGAELERLKSQSDMAA